jgi:hypothetical protein
MKIFMEILNDIIFFTIGKFRVLIKINGEFSSEIYREINLSSRDSN